MNLDKLTYAGNPANLAALHGDARFTGSHESAPLVHFLESYRGGFVS